MTNRRRQRHIEKLLEEFDVPDKRRAISKKSNIRWLLRNVGANNSDHPDINHLRKCLKEILSSLMGDSTQDQTNRAGT
jgi:hypothetical protein